MEKTLIRKRYEKVRYYVWRVWDPFLDFFWLARRGKSEARRHLAWMGWDQYAQLEQQVKSQEAVIATQREYAAVLEEELEVLREHFTDDDPPPTYH